MRYLACLLLIVACKDNRPNISPVPEDTGDEADADTDADADGDADADADSDTDSDTDTDTGPVDCTDVAGDNRTSAHAVPIDESATYRIERDQNDWFTLLVPAGSTVNVDVLFSGVDIDVRLRQNSSILTTGISSTPNESISWTNTGSTQVAATLEVLSLDEDCASYTIELDFE